MFYETVTASLNTELRLKYEQMLVLMVKKWLDHQWLMDVKKIGIKLLNNKMSDTMRPFDSTRSNVFGIYVLIVKLTWCDPRDPFRGLFDPINGEPGNDNDAYESRKIKYKITFSFPTEIPPQKYKYTFLL